MVPRRTYACPCCGYKTLETEPPGTYLICPVCFWEDNGSVKQPTGFYHDGSNQVSLRQAQRNFLDLGACEPQWVNDVRSPTEDEARDPDWQPLDVMVEQVRSDLIARIKQAFATVRLEDGISLHQARALDDYEDQWEARQIDAHVPWQEIPDEWIENFCDVFWFMDHKGFRHAIPAYLIWCLRYNKSTANSFWQTVNRVQALDDPGFDAAKLHTDDSFFSAAQYQVFSDFLQFMEIFEGF